MNNTMNITEMSYTTLLETVSKTMTRLLTAYKVGIPEDFFTESCFGRFADEALELAKKGCEGDPVERVVRRDIEANTYMTNFIATTRGKNGREITRSVAMPVLSRDESKALGNAVKIFREVRKAVYNEELVSFDGKCCGKIAPEPSREGERWYDEAPVFEGRKKR